MFKSKKEKCTHETVGEVIKRRWDGETWFLTVQYIVVGRIYHVKEQVRCPITKVHRAFNASIGITSKTSLENLDVGDPVLVRYDPLKPRKSYLPDNAGMHLL